MSPAVKSDDFTKKCHLTLKLHTCGHRTYTRPRLTHLGVCNLPPQSTTRCTNMASKTRESPMNIPCARCKPKMIVAIADPIEMLIKRAEQDKMATQRIAQGARVEEGNVQQAELTSEIEDNKDGRKDAVERVKRMEVVLPTSIPDEDTKKHQIHDKQTANSKKGLKVTSVSTKPSMMGTILSSFTGRPKIAGLSRDALHQPPRPGSPWSRPSSHWSEDSSDQEDEGWKVLTVGRR